YKLGAEIVIKKPISDFQLSSQLKILFQLCRYKQDESLVNFNQKNPEEENKKLSLETFSNLYNIVKGVADIIIITTKLGEIIDLSEQSYKLLGYNREEIVGKKISEIVSKLDIKSVREIESKLKTDFQSHSFEFTIKKKDGTLIVIQWINNKFTDNSNIERIYFVGKNITHDRIIDRELTKRERAFKSIFENSSDAIYIQDKQAVFIDVNPGAEKMYGYSHDELIGKTPEDVSAPEKNNLKEVIEKFNKAYNGEPQQFEFWGKRKNGEIFPKLVSLSSGSYYGQDVVFSFAIDITERKIAENTLRNSEEKYRLLIHNLNDVIWKMDLKFNLAYISPSVEKLLGYTQEEFIDLPKEKRLLPHELLNVNTLISKEIEKAKQGGINALKDVYIININSFHKDGRIIPCETKAYPVFEQNKVVGIQGITSDITKRKEEEKKLHESEKRFASFMEFLPSLVFIKNENGNYVYTNKHYNDFFGSNESVIGEKSLNLFPKSVAESIKIQDNEVLSNGVKIIEQQINNKHNKKHIFKTYKFPISLEDGTKLIGGFSLDITKEKKSDLIQQVLYNISNAVNTTYSTKEFFSIMQYELSKLVDTKNFYIAMYNKETNSIELPYMVDEKKSFDSAPMNSATAYVIKTEKSLLADKQKLETLEREGKFVMKGQKSTVWLGIPLKSNKKVIGMIGLQSYTHENAYNNSDKKILEIIATNIGFYIEREKANNELLIAKEKAEESDKLKSVFLANMSHEIRTPMNGMIGFAEMLKLKNLSEEKRNDFVDIISQSGQRLLTVITDIIDVSKIEAKQIKLNKKNVSLNKIFEEVNVFFVKNRDLEEKKLKVFYQLPDNNRVIYTDGVRVKQILSNLVANAIKFTEKGSVSFGYTLLDNNTLQFFVKDTGIGIRKEDTKIIFEKFRQIDEGSTRKYGGTGIGLAISKKIVEMLDGENWVESEFKKGTTFYFTLRNSNPKNDNSSKHKIVERKKINLYRKNKILVAEDDQFNFELLENVLDLPDIELIRAKNGKEAVEIAKSNKDIDIILMDIKMPEKDGYTATSEIKKFRPNLPIIAQTAYAMEGDEEKAFQAGCDDYIAKPISPDKLILVINQYI
ncbi:MAG: PAS domain S-box protein, partial [Bacteroidales bacterium]|nr:PAS domain S-box protein [Bacteroidales bacterium]